MEIPSYIVELIEDERKENREFREEVRADLATLREWTAVHEAQHAAGKDLKKLVLGGLGGLLAFVSGVVIPITAWLMK